MKIDFLKEVAFKYPRNIIQPFDEIINLIGFDKVYKLVDLYGGTQLYIPTVKRLFSGCIAMQIKTEYDGKNLKNLAQKYNFCERTIRNYVFDQ